MGKITGGTRLALLCGVVLAAPASASAIDVIVGNGTPASCNEAALDAAVVTVAANGGGITFNCGGPATINITSRKLFYESDNPNLVYAIDGGGRITLNAQGVTRHILHLSGTLYISNISLTGGRAVGAADDASGGAIRSDTLAGRAILNLLNVTFTNNATQLTSWQAPFSPFDYGGAAVFTRSAFLNVSGCTFSGNTAVNSGGGAIHGRSSTIGITGSSFVSNVSNGGGFGGAIHVDGLSPNGSGGALSIATSTFSNNTALQQGGAVFFAAHQGLGESVTIDRVQMTGNRVVDSGNIDWVGTRGWGGAIAGNYGHITIRNSTFSGNSARGQVSVNGGGFGGGLSLTISEALTIVNSTISGNVASGAGAQGGGLLTAGSAAFQIVDSTITLNQASGPGGGIYTDDAGSLTTTIVSNNAAASGSQCSRQLVNGGGALQFPSSTPLCANSIIVADPLLAPLTNNGGSTLTHHPQPGSPVINRTTCASPTDQRGVPRPQGPACDIGSVEVTCSISLAPLTLPTGRAGTPYSQTFSSTGGSAPLSFTLSGALPSGMSFNPNGTLSGTPSQAGAFLITVRVSDAFACATSRTYNLVIASSVAMAPTALSVDPTGNGVLEPNQAAIVGPTWMNQTGAPVANLTGSLSSFIGPAGATYSIQDATAAYGSIGNGAAASCLTAGNCYVVSIAAAARPEIHWDASAVETLSTGGPKAWTLHVGGSFADVPASSLFFQDVETLLHHGITGGCGGSSYCPGSATTREQMAVFVLLAREGAGYTPAACSPPNTFDDVPATSPFCRYIEELERRGVASGCGGNNYCPSQSVTREQMAVFVLRTLDPNMNPPACSPPNTFADVPETSPFCRWIEELARRGVVGGCGGGNYCPTSPVTRDQMGVFLSGTFGLTLYGP